MDDRRWTKEALEHVPCDYCGGEEFREVATRPDGLRVVECWRCGLAFVNPRPSEEAIEKLYGEDYFDEGARETYQRRVDEAVARKTTPEAEYVERLVELKGKRLLDVGCAYGSFLHVARLRGAEVEGVELSDDAARLAQERLGLTVYVGTLDSLKLAGGSYDVVTAFEVIEDAPRPSNFAEELARLAAPGGVVILSTPNYRCQRLYGDKWLGFHAGMEHLYYFSDDILLRMFGRLGLAPVSVDTVGTGRPPRVDFQPTGIRAWLDRALGLVGLLGPVRRALSCLRRRRPTPFGNDHFLYVAVRKP